MHGYILGRKIKKSFNITSLYSGIILEVKLSINKTKKIQLSKTLKNFRKTKKNQLIRVAKMYFNKQIM